MNIQDQLADLNERLPLMPIHTNISAKIPNSYSMGLPKDLEKHSIQYDDKFLNNTQYIIEEINHRDPKNKFISELRNYQISKFAKSGVLSHDVFYNISPELVETAAIGSFVFMNQMMGFASVNRGASVGADLSGGGTSVHQAQSSSYVYAILVGGGSAIVDSLYDRVAFNVFGASGANHRLGVYSDSSNDPNTRLATTGSTAVSTGFNWESVTEFAITTARTYAAFQVDGAGQDIYQDSSQTISLDLNTYASGLPDPWSESVGDNMDTVNMKIGHS